MIIEAIDKHNIDKKKSFLVGDKKTDVEAAKNANIKGYLFNGDNLLDRIKEILINF